MTIELPEHLRTGPLADAARQSLQDAASMASASNAIPRVSLRGREFRFVENGEEVYKARDETPVVILGIEPAGALMIKTWYKDGYKPGAKEPPTCSSDDGVAPAPWVTERQSQTCAACPKNRFDSATSPNGKPTKACRDSKRAWIKRMDDKETRPFADRPLFGLGITVASLKAFSDHGRKLTQLGQGPAVCITKLKMLDTEFPQLEFEIQAWLDAPTTKLSLETAQSRPWKAFTAASLALSMGEEGRTRAQLPMSGAPELPAHLRQGGGQQISEVVETSPEKVISEGEKPAVNAKAIDDAVGNW